MTKIVSSAIMFNLELVLGTKGVRTKQTQTLAEIQEDFIISYLFRHKSSQYVWRIRNTEHKLSKIIPLGKHGGGGIVVCSASR